MALRKLWNSVLAAGLCVMLAGCAQETGSTSSGSSAVQETTEAVTAGISAQADTAATEVVDIPQPENMDSVFSSMLGWVGTAGSSLKAASCALDALSFANSTGASAMDADVLSATVQNAYDSFSDDEKQQIQSAWEEVSADADGILSDDADTMNMLSSAGLSESAQVVRTQEGASVNWSALQSAVNKVVQDGES